jgi:hypothetical protein
MSRRDRLCEHSLFERHENAGIAGGRVHRADKGDDKQRPEIRDHRKAGPGRRHQHRRGEQQPTSRIAIGNPPDPQRQQGGADQRAGHDRTDRQRAESERDEVDGKQQRDKAIAERPHAARRQDTQRIGRSPGRHRPPPLVSPRQSAAHVQLPRITRPSPDIRSRPRTTLRKPASSSRV